jgi:hypothetical protein
MSIIENEAGVVFDNAQRFTGPISGRIQKSICAVFQHG